MENRPATVAHALTTSAIPRRGERLISNRTFAHAVADAVDGIRQAFVDQPNFRAQIFLGVVAVVLGAVLRFNVARWTVLALTIGFVLAAELFNTCLEHIVDLIQ